MDLEFGELRSFLVLAEQLHFGRAAELLYISQPALSKQIQRLEEKLGGPLLTRQYRRVALTAAGEILRDSARHILRDAESAGQLARLAIDGQAGLLRVGFGIASLTAGLPALLLRFRTRYPHANLTMRDMSTPDQIQALLRREIDVGFVRLPIHNDALTAVPVLDERLVVAFGVHSPPERVPGLSRWSESPFVVCSRASSASYYDHVVRTCRAAGFAPKIVQEANELFTVLNLVRAGLGVSLVPSSARLMRVPQVKFADTKVEEAKWSIGVAWFKSFPIPPLVANFVALARESWPEAHAEKQ